MAVVWLAFCAINVWLCLECWERDAKVGVAGNVAAFVFAAMNMAKEIFA